MCPQQHSLYTDKESDDVLQFGGQAHNYFEVDKNLLPHTK